MFRLIVRLFSGPEPLPDPPEPSPIPPQPLPPRAVMWAALDLSLERGYRAVRWEAV